MIEKFDTYLFNSLIESVSSGELSVKFTKRLRDLLYTINDNISLRLNSIENTSNFKTKRLFIDFDDSDPKRLSFLMINKLKDVFGETDSEHIINNNYDYNYFNKGVNNKFRGNIGINQFVNEIFNNEYVSKSLTDSEKEYNKINGIKSKSQELEEFVNKFKSYRTPGVFELVSGKDIIKWYNHTNYTQGNGELNSSCMRYTTCASYINFYAINIDKVSLLIMKNREDNDRIIGRALVWKLSNNDNRLFMDRIYTVINSDVELFKSYAKQQKWLYKYNQNMDSDEFIVDPISGDKEKITLEVNDIKSYEDYPYMDTFKYYSEIKGYGTLTNSFKNLPFDKNIYKLESTEGGYFGGVTIDEMKDNIIDEMINDIFYYIRLNSYNSKFWEFVDNKKFIENYIKGIKEEMFDSFNSDFSIDSIKKIISVIHPEYSESIKDITTEKIDYYLSNNLKMDIIKYHLDNYYNKQDITPQYIFERLMGKSLRSLNIGDYNKLFIGCFDDDGFVRSVVDNLSIDLLFQN